MAHHIPKIEYGSFVPVVIAFTYPPTDIQPETRVIHRKVVESLSGVRQVQFENMEAVRKLKFRFLTEAQKTSLESFLDNFAAQGKSFKYFDDKDGATYKVYEWDQEKFEPKVVTSVGPNTYIYEVTMQFRRVADDTIPEGYMEQELLNNQAALDIDGLVLDSTAYKSVQIFFEIFRKTNSSEIVSNGWFKCFYHESTGNWTLEPGSYEGDASGVTFSVTTGGQVKYASDNMAGTGYEGNLLLRNFTIVGGV